MTENHIPTMHAKGNTDIQHVMSYLSRFGLCLPNRHRRTIHKIISLSRVSIPKNSITKKYTADNFSDRQTNNG